MLKDIRKNLPALWMTGMGCLLVAGVELFFGLSLHNLSPKEVSIFVWAQGVAIGFYLILFGRIGQVETKIKDIEQRMRDHSFLKE